ncbi:MAG TPA: aliphatic sulfonate ABC transporter substrate-binding protein, partial [Hymenobacter sp.]
MLVGLASCGGASSSAKTEQPETVRLDYAYYNPLSLVLKQQGWLEKDLAQQNIKVEWVLSQGSNKALEYLNGSSIDFGSTAGAAALIGRANGNPLKAIYIYSKPEWTALVTGPKSGIRSVADLKGKRVAATRGTDPYIFLLRALDQAGLSEKDIELIPLQHPDGRAALEKGDVDAWAGLDPHMAKAELESGAQLFYRNPD